MPDRTGPFRNKSFKCCGKLLQVIQHPWSKKLNVDIQATVTVQPDNGDAPGSTPGTVQQPLPCWDWLFTAAQRTIEDAQRSFTLSSAQSQGGGPSPFVNHGWCLPYSYEEVSLVCVRMIFTVFLYIIAAAATTCTPRKHLECGCKM